MLFVKLRRKTGTIDRKCTQMDNAVRTRLARLGFRVQHPSKWPGKLTMTYLGLFCWFSGDGASCLNTVSEGKARRASLKTADIDFYCWFSLLSYLSSRGNLCAGNYVSDLVIDEPWSIFIAFYRLTFQNNLENCPARDYFGDLDSQFLLYCNFAVITANRLKVRTLFPVPRNIVTHGSLYTAIALCRNAKCLLHFG